MSALASSDRDLVAALTGGYPIILTRASLEMISSCLSVVTLHELRLLGGANETKA